MKEIALKGGDVALVDDSDFEWLSRFNWHRQGRYAARYDREPGERRNRVVLMHREILQTPPGFVSDHISGDGLDNRRANLRVCTHAENMRNRKTAASNRSGYKGVYFEDHTWSAQIRHNGKKIRIGRYDTAEEAHAAYCKAAQELHGEFARLGETDPTRAETFDQQLRSTQRWSGEQILKLRARFGLSRVDISNLVGLPETGARTTVYRWERGVSLPSQKYSHKLSEVEAWLSSRHRSEP